MNFNDRDLLGLQKDMERVRRHEEWHRSKEPKEEVESAPIEARERTAQHSVPAFARLRAMLETVLGPPEPSDESLKAIPELVVTLLQLVREQRKFANWLLAIEAIPPEQRNQLLQKMSFAFRIEDGGSPIAHGFDRLHKPTLFKAFCQVLRDEKQTSA